MRIQRPGACLNLHHEEHESAHPKEYPGHRARQKILRLRGQQVVYQRIEPATLWRMLEEWVDKGIQPDDKPHYEDQPEYKEHFSRPFHRSCPPSMSNAGDGSLLKSRSWSRTTSSCLSNSSSAVSR